MSIIKKLLIICLILAICLPIIETVYAHSVTLDPEDLISFPSMIWNGEGTITIDSSVSNYSLYYQAIPIPEEDYAQIKAAESAGEQELNVIKEEYEAMKTGLTELENTYRSVYEEYQQKMQDTSLQESDIETFRSAYETAKTNYDNKVKQYNNKIDEYNSKVNEVNERVNGLTPSYNDNNWTKSINNEFKIDRTQFTGNLAHAVWAKLVTSDNQTYYEEATYTIEGTKEDVEVPENTTESKKIKKTRLDVIQKASETKYLENDQGYISKTIVDSNPDTGEVTIELKLSNKGKEIKASKDTEIFLVVDNSPSMDFITSSGKTRKEIVLNAANSFAESVMDLNSNIKIGLVDFHGSGLFESSSIYNATLRQELTNNKEEILNALHEQLERNTSSGTNIEAGLLKAEQNFSSDSENNKIIILLTDGIPNNDTRGNSSGNDVTTEKSLEIQNNTKQTLLELKNKNIYTITMLTGMDESDGRTDKSGTVYEGSTIEEELIAAENVFGTQENPVADKYYLAKSVDVNSVITNDVFNDVSKKVNSSIRDVKIVDYFPEDITDNFDFSYVGSPSIGTTSDTIDAESKTITWDMGTLKGNEEATLKYKLKIKDMQNSELLNKTIATNEKVVLTYKDLEDKDYTVILTSSPKIQLTEVKEDESGKNNSGGIDTNDPTIAPNKTLPNTGLSIAIIASVLLVIISGISLLAKYKTFKDVK